MINNIIKLLIFLTISLSPIYSWAQSQANYDSTVTVEIPDQDTVFARNHAFQILKKQILIDAIKDQLGILVYEEFSSQILRNKSIRINELISAFKIEQEYTIGEKFTMKLQGTVRLDDLNETLREMNLVLKDDPWYHITLVTEENLTLPLEDLQKKLEIYHIKIDNHIVFRPESEEIIDYQSYDFIEKLYYNASDNQILYFVGKNKDSESGLVDSLKVRIYRKLDYKQINEFDIKLKDAVDTSAVNAEIDKVTSRTVSAFSIQTIKRHLYDEGLESVIDIEVSGLTSPFERNEFEKHVIHHNKSIQKYTLKNLSKENVEYKLFSKNTIARLLEYFERKNEAFDLIVELNGINKLQIYAIYKLGLEVVELDSWSYNSIQLKKISNVINNSDEIDESLMPEIVEKEPNNNSRKFNFLPNNTMLIGKVLSRADEDIYQFEEPLEPKTSITIEWMIASKTSLSPQLKLYDSEFKFLNSYALIGRQNKMKFSYTFQVETPKRIYIRISDAVGFIQGETGGYKSFDYLLRMKWND